MTKLHRVNNISSRGHWLVGDGRFCLLHWQKAGWGIIATKEWDAAGRDWLDAMKVGHYNTLFPRRKDALQALELALSISAPPV